MFMYTRRVTYNMAKLYWRIKENGKWTWVAADSSNTLDDDGDEWLPMLTYNDPHHQQVMEEEE